jgi:hypothetical protein
VAKLTTAERNKLPASDFAGPGRSYPIPDKSHAANAKARAAQHASPALKAKIDAKANKILGKSDKKPERTVLGRGK